MNWVIIGLLILCILMLILITLLIDEKRFRSAKSPSGKMTAYWNGMERRASIRVSTILNTRYSVDKKLQVKNSLSKNVGAGGILMESSEKLTTSTQLLLDISLPDGQKPITAKGEVVWIRELSHVDEMGRKLFDAGIKFVSMNTKDKERLDKHIQGINNMQHG